MNYFAIGAISACIVIILGAFGAHGLKDLLGDYGQSIYDKAVLYHMFHSIAILIVGIIQKLVPDLELQLSGLFFLLGIIIFSGSLYILSITGIKSLGMVTPIGGALFILGWITLFILYK